MAEGFFNLDGHSSATNATGSQTGGGVTLPLVAEVRAARARADRAVQAAVLLQRALALETSLALVGPANTSVPEQLLALFREAEALEPESSIDLETGDADSAKVRLRVWVTRLRDLAADQESSALALHQLQHQQQHALAHHEDVALVQELHDLGEERTRIQVELVPIDQQVAVLEPMLERLNALLGDESQRALARVEATPDEGQRLLALLTTFLASVGAVLEASGIEADLPEPPTDASHEALSRALESFVTWSEHLDSSRARVHVRAGELHDRYAEIQERLMAVLG